MGAVALPAAMIGSSLIGAGASSGAASAQENAANQANATQMQMFNTAQQNLAPYIGAGNAATSRLADLLGTSGNTGAPGYGSLTTPFNAQTFAQNLNPAYSWQLLQGNRALQNSQAAQDGVLSGAALKDLIGYNQDMASTAYQNAFNNYQTQQGNTYQRLLGLSGLGQASAAGNATNAINTGNNLGANIVGAGNAAAAGMVGQANAINNGVNNGMGYYMFNQMLNNPAVAANSSLAFNGGTNGSYDPYSATSTNPANPYNLVMG